MSNGFLLSHTAVERACWSDSLPVVEEREKRKGILCSFTIDKREWRVRDTIYISFFPPLVETMTSEDSPARELPPCRAREITKIVGRCGSFLFRPKSMRREKSQTDEDTRKRIDQFEDNPGPWALNQQGNEQENPLQTHQGGQSNVDKQQPAVRRGRGETR